jgi:hypothetical protein
MYLYLWTTFFPHTGECTFGHSWAVRFRKRHNLPTKDQNGRKRKRHLGEDEDDEGEGRAHQLLPRAGSSSSSSASAAAVATSAGE